MEVKVVKGDEQWVFNIGKGEAERWEEVGKFLAEMGGGEGERQGGEVKIWLVPCTGLR